MIRTVIFDIGGTLVDYPIPLNWSALYRPAFESIAAKNGLVITGNEYEHIGKVLAKYNRKLCPPPLRRRVPYFHSVGVQSPTEWK